MEDVHWKTQARW